MTPRELQRLRQTAFVAGAAFRAAQGGRLTQPALLAAAANARARIDQLTAELGGTAEDAKWIAAAFVAGAENNVEAASG
ncbi:MAG: hypothetical protein U1E62_21490 [Alsobacter sp.]